jgi:hypothetical protein
MKVRASLALTFTALLFEALDPAVVHAQAAAVVTPDVGKGYMVLLFDGNVVTGMLVERDATHVSLRLSTGETRRIPAFEIDKSGPLESGSSSDVPQNLSPMPPPLTKPATPTLDAMKPPRAEDNGYKGSDAVTLHLALPPSTTAVTLYQRTGDAWKSICTATCSPKVDPRGTYMVGGFMVVDSPSFALPPNAREVTVRSNPTFTPTPTIGWGLLAAGLFVAGLNTALYAALPGEKEPVFLIPIGIGAVLGIVGATLAFEGTSVAVTSP